MVTLLKTIHRMQRNKEKGFTLIELMIVVAILGILAAIAIPNFMRFQAKSKQSEAKTNLGAIGTTAEAWRSENDTYVATWAQLGWAPQGTTRYRYYYNGAALAGTPATAAGCEADGAGGNVSAATASTFTTVASGNVDSEATTCDQWIYDDSRDLDNTINDVSG